LDVTGRRLVTCGSVFQGTCQLRHMDDISDAVETDSRGNTDYFVAANDPLMSTVAFVAPGPGPVDALYVAATYTGTAATAVRQAVPAVSVRALDHTGTAFRCDAPRRLCGPRGYEQARSVTPSLDRASYSATKRGLILV